MAATETPKITGPPQIVKLDKALKLAERWVNNMSKGTDDEPSEADMEGRPSRLGLGAKVSRQSKVGPSNDPVDRKLYAKLNAEKRKTARIAEESKQSAGAGFDDDDDNKDLDSRTSAFAKRKAAVPLNSSVLGNKKQK
ncbi:hypothetical protein L6164_021120 [Bauhinia variegata]|uniref:Uncharacterized protein n=1 Tax=Bauhinia variegata TaxID=167791 RepID=A0ACB9MXP1_BAUVA|nr:hypothetical protein L6164_021120 [Bauhinia variegata]